MPSVRLLPAYNTQYARPCSARKRIRLARHDDTMLTCCFQEGRLFSYPPVSGLGIAQTCRHFQPKELPHEQSPPAKQYTGTGTEPLYWHSVVASAQAQAQSQGRIYGAEARRASIDGQITRQGPVGREGRQCRSHSGPLCWRPCQTCPTPKGSPWFAPWPKLSRPSCSSNRACPRRYWSSRIRSHHDLLWGRKAGQQEKYDRKRWVGTVIIGTERPWDARKENPRNE